MNIVKYGNKILKQVASPTSSVNKDVIDEMFSILENSNGIGLSAPQIGISERFFVISLKSIEFDKTCINPEIVNHSEETVNWKEGCMSIPNIQVNVPRHQWIDVKYENLDREIIEERLEDFPARVFQHELDHLDGKLIIDYLSPVELHLMQLHLKMIEKNEHKSISSKS